MITISNIIKKNIWDFSWVFIWVYKISTFVDFLVIVRTKGSRGRRSIDSDTATTISAENGNEANLKELSNLRDTIFGMGMQRNVRAPKGFFGMRGKKDYDLQNQEKRALLGIQQVCQKNFTVKIRKKNFISFTESQWTSWTHTICGTATRRRWSLFQHQASTLSRIFWHAR